MTEARKLFKEAQNEQAYLKAGILGFAGSGKTYTAALMAKGIYGLLPVKKPVYFLDTETGSDFLVPRFKEWGIPFHVSKSRVFFDLIEAVKIAEQEAGVLIIDSISHLWAELMRSYMKANNRKRLLFQDWGPIKETWGRFTDLYLNSKVHIIMNGRASYEYDYFTDDAGAKQLEKTGTKMSAESNMGYEPSLLIEMIRERKDNADQSVEAKLWDHVGIVLKDRTTTLEGKRFINPTFEDFSPYFKFLNIGGEHVGVEIGADSTVLFAKDSEENIFETRKRIAVLKEEIEGELTSAYPGRSTEEIKAKTDILFEAFATRSWAALDDMNIDRLKRGLGSVKEIITARKEAKKQKPKEEKKSKSKGE